MPGPMPPEYTLVISTERSEWRNLPAREREQYRLKTAFRQTGARECPFCALWRWLRCAKGRFWPVARRKRLRMGF